MNKNELIAAIAEKANFTKKQAEDALKAVFETITDSMMKQDKVAIPGFGGFQVKVREERKGRNPSTGKEMIIPKAMVVNFKAASLLKESINKQDK